MENDDERVEDVLSLAVADVDVVAVSVDESDIDADAVSDIELLWVRVLEETNGAMWSNSKSTAQNRDIVFAASIGAKINSG